ncbi:F-box/LRR-repeat protein 2-like [Montipora capricornis]|uniref:F-box/LRR-repeat protein 2-like n=1 Tax=Montipora foliosa TaxID=591990 RepID=UPI0035F1E100
MMDVSSCHGVVVKNHLCSQTLDLLQVFPAEIIFKIFCYLDLRSLCLCRCLSERWRTQVNLYLGSVIRLDFVPHEAILTECGLKHQLAYANNLQVLHLDRCWPSVTEENLFVIAQNCSKLSVFTASRCKGITDVALEAVAENCPQLTEVDLSSCFKISDAGVIALSKHCSNLQELHVSSCYGVTDKSIVSLSQQCLGLKELDVSWCFHVTDASLKLFLSPECTLKLLRIKDCNRVSQGVVSQLITKGIIVNTFF